MLLDAPCYQDLVEYFVYLLVIAEYDQVVGPILICVLHCVVQPPSFQAQ